MTFLGIVCGFSVMRHAQGLNQSKYVFTVVCCCSCPSAFRIALGVRDTEFDLSQKIPWRRKWQLTPVFLPGESRDQRSLKGCSP